MTVPTESILALLFAGSGVLLAIRDVKLLPTVTPEQFAPIPLRQFHLWRALRRVTGWGFPVLFVLASGLYTARANGWLGERGEFAYRASVLGIAGTLVIAWLVQYSIARTYKIVVYAPGSGN